jgi:xylose isomerase
MDTFARGLLVAHRMKEDGVLDDFIRERYSGYESGLGKQIMDGQVTLEELEEHAAREGEPELVSGRQEMLENILNDYIYGKDIR